MPIEASPGRRVFGTSTDEPIGLVPGAFVSLNLERRKMLATSRKELVLTYNQPTARVPAGLSDQDMLHLKLVLDRGEIVLGATAIAAPPRRGLLEPLYEELDRAERVDDIRHTIYRVANKQKFIDREIAPAEALRYLIVHESQKRCRTLFLNFLGAVMERTAGHSGVTEDVQDARTVVLPRKSDGTVVDTSPIEAPSEAHRAAVRSLI